MSRNNDLEHMDSKSLAIAMLLFPLKNPYEQVGKLYLDMFLQIIFPLVKELFIITGNYCCKKVPYNVKIINVKAPLVKSYKESVVAKFIRWLNAQFRLSLELMRLIRRLDVVVVLHMEGPILLPTLLARIKRKKILVTVGGSFYRGSKVRFKPPLAQLISAIMWIIEQLNYALASKITVASESMIEKMGLSRYKAKIVVNAVFSFVDAQRFSIKRTLSQRENIIGYVGRLDAAKGCLEFAKSIPLILSKKDDIKFLIIGDGPLKNEMLRLIERHGCQHKVDFCGWVPHENIPDYLNKMKIHVLPSYTEAIGGANLEAMACGAISVVNSAGGLPDVLSEGETGFLLKDNSPQTIADKLIKVLNFPDLDKIQQNARAFVEQNFSYKKVIERWQRILSIMK